MTKPPLSVMREMMTKNNDQMMQNSILREWFNMESFQKIEQNIREKSGIGNINFLCDSFIELVRKWQDSGKMRFGYKSQNDNGDIFRVKKRRNPQRGNRLQIFSGGFVISIRIHNEGVDNK